MPESSAASPPPIGLWALLRRFLHFGALAFGGPVAQIGMLHHELVQRDRWVDEARFRRVLAVYQALPGPEATELCIWFGTVVRGDVNFIRIGARTNIQDNSTIHVTHDTHPTIIGSDVVGGHQIILHGCVVKDRVLIGMGSTVLDGADVGEESIIGAGSGTSSSISVARARIVRFLPMVRPAPVLRWTGCVRRLCRRDRTWRRASVESRQPKGPSGCSSKT